MSENKLTIGFDATSEAARLADWIAGKVHEAGADGIVVGLSGGIDSAVTAALSARAVPGRVMGLLMPCHSDPRDLEDARLVASTIGIPTVTVNLDPVYDTFLSALRAAAGTGTPAEQEAAAASGRVRLAEANLKPRLRMATLYYFANRLHYLVAGTGNRSELEVGYFTKYGDGGVDILPIGHLVKHQVRELAQALGIPERIITRPPTAGLWVGQTDEGEMGLTYADLDRYLLTGEASPEVRRRIESMQRQSQHKKVPPPIPS